MLLKSWEGVAKKKKKREKEKNFTKSHITMKNVIV